MSNPDEKKVHIASSGVHTIGSPITLKLVFSNTGIPVICSYAISKLYKRSFSLFEDSLNSG